MKKGIFVAVALLAGLSASAQQAQGGCEDIKNDVQVTPASEEKIFEAVEQPASFPGGQPGLIKWLNMNLRYPEEAAKNNVIGRVIVQFIVETDGSIKQIRIAHGVHSALDAEALRVVESMPKWQPGRTNGKPVRSLFSLPIVFKLQEEEEPTKGGEDDMKKNISSSMKIYYNVDQFAYFPGGQKALLQWLSENMQYPETALANKISGRVTVQFAVNTDGTLSRVSVLESDNYQLNREARRLVWSMPKWEPAKYQGRDVRSLVTMPITFRLPE